MKEAKLIIDGQGTERLIRPATVVDNTLAVGYKKEVDVDWRMNFQRMWEVGQAWKEIYPYQDSARVDCRPLSERPDKPYLIWIASDMHIGNVDCDYKTLQKHTEMIENTPNTGLITLGDDIDMGILPKLEVRFMQAFPPYMQAFTAGDLMAEFSGRNPRGKQLALAHVIGNHTHTLMEQSGMLFEKFYEQSKAPMLPGIGELFLQVGNENYEFVLAHRYVGQSKLNRTLAPKRLMEYLAPNADVAIVGHNHQVANEKFFKGGKFHLAIRPGTYRVGTDLFENARGWGHGELGGSCVVLYPDRHEMLAFDKLEEGIGYLKQVI